MSMDDARQTFYAESREMLEEMENLLLELESLPDDPQQLDALFRCVHTIKGSAGLFALDHVVAFTHVVEDVLDRLRDHLIILDRELTALLLSCRDHIAALIELDEDILPEELRRVGEVLLKSLAVYQSSLPASATTLEADMEHGSTVEQCQTGDLVENDCWHLSLRFHADVLRNGMDPLGFLRYLGKLGTLRYVVTLSDDLPTAEDLDPERCYLGFEIDLEAETDKAAIEDVFDLVRDEVELFILPPRSELERYLQVIEALPEEDVRLGEILLKSGALTAKELDNVLSRQDAKRSAGDKEYSRLGEVLIEDLAAQPEVVGAALDKQQKGRQNGARKEQHVRVAADRLDALINLVGELVIASAAADNSAKQNGDTSTQEAVSTLLSLVEAVRDSSLELRMVPIGETFQRFQRVVRDVSQALGKDIRLQISGADTELDKTVVERITDPLTHLVRNAVDHGIEAVELRKQRGKDAQGTVYLNAYHETGSIVIEVSDDGGGLDKDKILAKAIQRELVKPDQELSQSEIFKLIFEAGFSTADAVSNLSGRGVGMDVVRRNIEALRGSIDVESNPGAGTLLRIRLPLTLAIIDGFLTGVGTASYVVPLENVVECLELSAEQRQESRDRNLINLRGEVLPFIRLRDYFDLQGEAGRRENIVVIKHGAQKAGLIVDVLMGEHQTVIKPLGRLFNGLKGISGSTILGTGEVALILDVPSLVQQSSRQEAACT